MLNNVKEKARDSQEANLAANLERAGRYHRVFAQSPDGQKILEEMVRRYCMAPTRNADATMFQLGIVEGKRAIVAEIIDMISFITNR